MYNNVDSIKIKTKSMDISKPQPNIPNTGNAPKPPQPPPPSNIPPKFAVPPVPPKGPVNPYERVNKPTPLSTSRPGTPTPSPTLPKKPTTPSAGSVINDEHPQVLTFPDQGGSSKKKTAAALIVVLGAVLVVLLLGIIIYVILTSGKPKTTPSFPPVPSSVASTPEATAEATPEVTSSLLGERYTHTSGFSIIPPASWTADETQKLADVLFSDPASTDAIKANITVLSEKLPAGMTLEKYVASSKKQLKASYRNYNLVDDAPVSTVSGQEAYIIGGTLKENNVQVRNKQLIILSTDSKTAYVVTATADPGVWEEKNYNALFDQVLTSFEEPAQATETSPSPTASTTTTSEETTTTESSTSTTAQ